MTNQAPIELLADGNYCPNDIKLNVSHQPIFNYDQSFQNKLDQLWQEQLADAKQKGYKLWNSETYALKSIKQKDNRLLLDVGLVEYRNQVGIVKLFEAGEIGVEQCSPLMYCSEIVRTADGKYVFGIGKGFVHDGTLKFVGGSYSKDELVLSDGQSLFELPLIEMKEEINVDVNNIQDISLKQIYRTARGMIDITFFIQLNTDAKQVKEMYSELEEHEFAELKIYPKAEAKQQMLKLGGHRALKIDLLV